MVWLLLIWGLAIFVAHRIGQSKHRPGLIWWGILLGWIGVIIAACSKPGVPPPMAWGPPDGPRIA